MHRIQESATDVTDLSDSRRPPWISDGHISIGGHLIVNGNSLFITVTEAKYIVSVTSLPLLSTVNCQQCKHECVSLCFPPPAVWTWVCIPFHSQQCGHEGVSLLTANNVDVRVSFPPHAVWTCRVYPSPPSYNVFKCWNAGLYGIRSVRYWNGLKCRCRKLSGTGITMVENT